LCSITLHTPKNINLFNRGDLIRYSLKPKYNLLQARRNLGLIVTSIVTECSGQYRTLVKYFPNEHVPDNRGTSIRSIRSTILFSP